MDEQRSRFMQNLHYYSTLICVSDDCPVKAAAIPQRRGETPTIPELEYTLLSKSPGKYTQEDVLFEVHLQRLGLSKSEQKAQKAKLWKEFFSKSRACLRASSLPKRYGWGLLFDEIGKITLVPMESEQYKTLSRKSSGVTLLKAMRNQRA